MCQENKGGDVLPALKTALIHRYNDLKIAYKSVGKDTRNNIDNTRINRTEITRKQNFKKQLYGRFKRLTSNNLHGET